ncbi:hypothetical protein SORBI_3003G145200 [Sorghum bicolor]|uniref:Uncharacterized protein n=1 Tax=Sorghum bicolor TaxID=4558 RepID=A0A1B6Q382_SORBI|nr:hypothetical protein SORBI_3003G145200 [Sorghum bicolor]
MHSVFSAPTQFRMPTVTSQTPPPAPHFETSLRTAHALGFRLREREERKAMENTSSDRGGSKPGIRFGFSWADEVEREEREQQEEEQRRWETEREQIKADPFGGARPREVEQRRCETEREQIKADPFGAARPREVVLAEKGVDWRARDRELDLHLRTAPRPRRSRKRAAATGTSKGAVAAHGATPERGALRDQDAAGAGRTPHPRGRRAAASTPPLPPTVSHSAWGGSKRKCAGEGPGPLRRVRQVDDQRRKVFGELNVGEGCGSSIRASNNKSCDSGGSQAQGIKSSMPVVADGENRCSMVPATKVTATEVGESAVAQKRRGGKRRKGKRSKKTTNQETLVS